MHCENSVCKQRENFARSVEEKKSDFERIRLNARTTGGGDGDRTSTTVAITTNLAAEYATIGFRGTIWPKTKLSVKFCLVVFWSARSRLLRLFDPQLLPVSCDLSAGFFEGELRKTLISLGRNGDTMCESRLHARLSLVPVAMYIVPTAASWAWHYAAIVPPPWTLSEFTWCLLGSSTLYTARDNYFLQ